MFIITPKREFLIKLACFLVVLSLCVAIFIHGQGLECGKCKIHFESYQTKSISPGAEVQQDFYVKIEDIYDYLLRDQCLVEFNLNDGYIYLNIINVSKN